MKRGLWIAIFLTGCAAAPADSVDSTASSDSGEYDLTREVVSDGGCGGGRAARGACGAAGEGGRGREGALPGATSGRRPG